MYFSKNLSTLQWWSQNNISKAAKAIEDIGYPQAICIELWDDSTLTPFPLHLVEAYFQCSVVSKASLASKTALEESI